MHCDAVIPPFHAAVDQAITYLHPTEGLLGCCDFFVSSKFDLPLRQMPWLRRFFWRCGRLTICMPPPRTKHCRLHKENCPAALHFPCSLMYSGQAVLPSHTQFHGTAVSQASSSRAVGPSQRRFDGCEQRVRDSGLRHRSVFDTDSIDLGPERRQYLDHQLSRLWEVNSQGSIPYVPLLRAPYYCWIGHMPQLATVLSENKVRPPPLYLAEQGRPAMSPVPLVRSPSICHFSACSAAHRTGRKFEPLQCLNAQLKKSVALEAGVVKRGTPPRQVEAPPLFPPTFLYNSSWEDPEKDMKALRVGPGDTCLTLTSGGCNALNLCLQARPTLPGRPPQLFRPPARPRCL